jgi:ankyrin repeat protein
VHRNRKNQQRSNLSFEIAAVRFAASRRCDLFFNLSKAMFMRRLLTLVFFLGVHTCLSAQPKDVFLAARLGDRETIETALNHGTAIDTATARGFTMLMLAVYNKRTHLSYFLIERGANIHLTDFMGNTVLMSAAFKGETELARHLIEKGANVNARNSLGVTALMFAAMAGHKETVSMLIQHGADVNAIDQRGFTALALALHNGAKEIVELLSGLSGIAR